MSPPYRRQESAIAGPVQKKRPTPERGRPGNPMNQLLGSADDSSSRFTSTEPSVFVFTFSVTLSLVLPAASAFLFRYFLVSVTVPVIGFLDLSLETFVSASVVATSGELIRAIAKP